MAEVQNIELKDGEPVTVTVKLTTEEAAWVASRAGETVGEPVATGLYNDLASAYFSRFWADGVAGYLNGDEPA